MLISFKVCWDMYQSKSRQNLLLQIKVLEREHEVNPTAEVYQNLQSANEDLKLLDAQDIAKDILYARQWVFGYHNKAGKQLARVLAENSTTYKVIGIRKEDGELTISSIEKFEIFASYCSNLCSLSNPSHLECNFLQIKERSQNSIWLIRNFCMLPSKQWR